MKEQNQREINRKKEHDTKIIINKVKIFHWIALTKRTKRYENRKYEKRYIQTWKKAKIKKLRHTKQIEKTYRLKHKADNVNPEI